MENKNGYSALIINSSKIQSVSSAVPLTFVTTGKAARGAILDPARRFAAIFLDPVFPQDSGLELISLAHRYRPATPIYLLHDGRVPFTIDEMKRLGLQGAVQLPLSSSHVKERISQEIFDNYFEETTQAPQILTHSAEDPHFLPVPAADFLTGVPSLFDVYVRLPSGRYFKILNAKDNFAPSRVLGYVEKGLTHFYLRKESQQRCLTYCDLIAHYLLTHRNISFEMKVSNVYQRGEKVIQAIRQRGLTPDHLDFALTCVSDIRTLIRQTNLENQGHIKAFLENITAYDRAVSTTMIAALIALPLEIQTETAFRAVGLAALLHDIGLYQMPPDAQLGNEDTMSPEVRRLYRTHPVVGAEMLSQLKAVDSVTIQAVAQHHERRHNRGFPGKAAPDEINRVAEIVGISDEFIDLLIKAEFDPSLDPLREMEKSVFAGFSFPIIQSFRTVFKPAK
ncbi:MAG: hypothetical protein A2X94_00775 [Bdellovibrionales bacterium GWB1_55_8]|nr:MAG: hypothetical protein A2X94_00775 [Bdellovibrionales bacterium GWB1_55_8]